ncbi:hypothetical protein CPB84DRAFT_1795955 [Gymnopilus junonius]|uniref:Uncharacterized protein n=1 Tax=Gymnopilus junonius TaxID=109634 RepID=A0A9P5TGW3_GYMJU|nr:hypothetical protein CPB84DRAFT_1795955 [Gymnopilus junonius]
MADVLDDHIKYSGSLSERNPMVHVSPTLEEYRAFLWWSYASDEELKVYPHEQHGVDRLYLLLSIASKYYFDALETWAHLNLHSTVSKTDYIERCSDDSRTLLTQKCIEHHLFDTLSIVVHDIAQNEAHMDSISSAELVELVETCIKYRFLDTLSIVVEKWCRRLEAKADTPSVPAILIADKYLDVEEHERDAGVCKRMLTLRTVAYYIHLQLMAERTQPSGLSSHSDHDLAARCAPLHLPPEPKLNSKQIMRLLRGYWSFTSVWERLRLKPTPLPRASSCSAEHHEKICVKAWEHEWLSACGWQRILGINGADLLGLIECLRDQLNGDEELKEKLNDGCRMLGLDGLVELKARTKEGLVDHFSDAA